MYIKSQRVYYICNSPVAYTLMQAKRYHVWNFIRHFSIYNPIVTSICDHTGDAGVSNQYSILSIIRQVFFIMQARRYLLLIPIILYRHHHAVNRNRLLYI